MYFVKNHLTQMNYSTICNFIETESIIIKIISVHKRITYQIMQWHKIQLMVLMILYCLIKGITHRFKANLIKAKTVIINLFKKVTIKAHLLIHLTLLGMLIQWILLHEDRRCKENNKMGKILTIYKIWINLYKIIRIINRMSLYLY